MSTEGQKPPHEPLFRENGLPNREAISRMARETAVTDQLSQPFGLYEPLSSKLGGMNATELLRDYDGTFRDGDYAIRVDINDEGEVSPVLTRRPTTASSGMENHGHEVAD